MQLQNKRMVIDYKDFARVVWWRSAKAPQTPILCVRTPNPYGFIYFQNKRKMSTKNVTLETLPTPVIEFENWQEVFNLAYDILSVCETTALTLGQNRHTELNDWEHGQVYGSNSVQIKECISFVKRLLPIFDVKDIIKG